MPTGQALIEQMNTISILPNSLAIWGLGQMGVAIKGPDGIIYIDPCLSDVVRERFGDFWGRAYPTPLEPHEITNAEYILSSHEHLDHLDPLTLGPAAKASPYARFIVTGWSVEPLAETAIAEERLMIPHTLSPMELPGTSIRLTAVPAAHYAKEHDESKGYRWFGYVIEWNGVTFYHAGDTIIYPGYTDMWHSLPRPDVAMLPINGRDWYRETDAGAIGNLLPVEAARLARDLHWDTLIVGHNDLYPNNMIPMGQVVDGLAKVAPRQKFKVLQPGELFYYVK
jgi:L-ascorbate metabolism protein UlaG (beta-lactamase superfamily)